jgi:hypothetical protein
MSTLKPHISSFDKSYSGSNSKNYRLYVELGINGLKHVILNVENQTFIGIEEYQFTDVYNDYSLLEPVKNILSSNPIYNYEYDSIHVALANSRSTLIPHAVFKPDQLQSYHQFNFSKQEEDKFFSDHLINLSAHNVYSIPDYLSEPFQSLKHVHFLHFSSPLIESTLLLAKKEKALSLIHVHVLPSSFQVIVVKNQQLELYNSFIYQSSEDFIYYLLFVLDQLNINNEEADVTLTGAVEKNSVIYTMMHKYIKSLRFGQRPDNLKFSYNFEEIPEHFHYSLLNQFLCE